MLKRCACVGSVAVGACLALYPVRAWSEQVAGVGAWVRDEQEEERQACQACSVLSRLLHVWHICHLHEQEASSSGTELPKSAMGKAFSNADKKVRDKAVAVFSKWISRQEALNDEVQSCSAPLPRPAPPSAAPLLANGHACLGCEADGVCRLCLQDHLRIWKALFYCFWMSDKVPVQRELAERLAGLINVCPNQDQTEHFIRAFYRTMQREWGGIDRLRMDKFYNLIRCFQRETFVYLAKSHWRSESIAWVNAILTKGPIGLIAAEGAAGHVSKTPGLQLHMVDIFLEEVTEALNQGITAETWMQVLEPYIQLLGSAVDKAVFERVYERVFKELAGKKWLAASIEQEDEDETAFKSKKLRVCIVPLLPMCFFSREFSFFFTGCNVFQTCRREYSLHGTH